MSAKTFLALFSGAAIVGAAASFAACSSSSGSATPAIPTTQANGTIGSWTTAAPMPKPRANHCAVAAGGYLVVIGGNYAKDPSAASPTFVNLDEVDTAKINPDGSLGPWIVAGKTPAPVSSCTAAAFGTTIVLVDGIYDDESIGKTSFIATVDASGMVSTFTASGAVPADSDLFYSSAWVDGPDGGEILHAFNAVLPSDDGSDAGAITLYSTPISATAWSEEKFAPAFRGHPQYAFAKDFIYAMGGYASGGDASAAFSSEVIGAAKSFPGAIGAAFDTTALPQPTMFGDAIAVDGYLFVIGGRASIFGGNPRADVSSAPIGADGKIGAWSAQTALPEARSNARAVASGDYLYVVGGGNTGPGLDSVYSAQIKF